MSTSVHTPVMTESVLEFLQARHEGSYLDCTLGGGSHTRAILDAHPGNRVTALDRDMRAIERSAAWAKAYADRLQVIHAAFSDVAALFRGTRFQGVLADLGTSSDQLEEGRGFSFQDSNSLDMRMDERGGQTAAMLVNQGDPKILFTVLKQGGVGTDARRIVDEIVRNRPIENARVLAGIIEGASSRKQRTEKKIHPATVAFQAIRMAVNQELEEIQNLLEQVPALVSDHGRLVVICFHSLEDKLVASTMRQWEVAERDSFGRRSGMKGKLLTKKATFPSEAEISENSRARSARLRAFEFFTEG